MGNNLTNLLYNEGAGQHKTVVKMVLIVLLIITPLIWQSIDIHLAISTRTLGNNRKTSEQMQHKPSEETLGEKMSARPNSERVFEDEQIMTDHDVKKDGKRHEQNETIKEIKHDDILPFNFQAFCSFAAFVLTFILFLTEGLSLNALVNLRPGDTIEYYQGKYFQEFARIRCITGPVIGIILLISLRWNLLTFHLFAMFVVYLHMFEIGATQHEGRVIDKDIRSPLYQFITLTAINMGLLLLMLCVYSFNFSTIEALYNSVLVGLSLPVWCSVIQFLETERPSKGKRGKSGKHGLIMNTFIFLEIVFSHYFSVALYNLTGNAKINTNVLVFFQICYIVLYINNQTMSINALVAKMCIYVLVFFLGTSCVVPISSFKLLAVLIAIIGRLLLSTVLNNISSQTSLICNYIFQIIIFLYLSFYPTSLYTFIVIILNIVRIFRDKSQILGIPLDVYVLHNILFTEITVLASLYLVTLVTVILAILLSLVLFSMVILRSEW